MANFGGMVTPEDNPPVIRFEKESIEDVEATEKANDGYVRYREIEKVYISARGDNKCEVPYEANDWVEKLKWRHRNKLISENYFEYCKDRLSRWRKGQAEPVAGTPLKEWTMEAEHLKRMAMDLGYQTVEQVAEMTEDAMNTIGMGSRMMKKKAIKWLEADKSVGATAQKVLRLEREAEAHKRREEKQTELLSNFQAKLQDLEAKLAKKDAEEAEAAKPVEEKIADSVLNAVTLPIEKVELEQMDKTALVREARLRGVNIAGGHWKEETLIKKILEKQHPEEE